MWTGYLSFVYCVYSLAGFFYCVTFNAREALNYSFALEQIAHHRWSGTGASKAHIMIKLTFKAHEIKSYLLNEGWRPHIEHDTCALIMWQVPRWAGCVPWTNRVWICLHCLQTERDYVPCVNQASLHWGRRPAGTLILALLSLHWRHIGFSCTVGIIWLKYINIGQVRCGYWQCVVLYCLSCS